MNKRFLIIVLLALAVGLAGGYWFANSKQADKQQTTSSTGKKILFYRSPMNPSVTSPVPAKDSMGMDYVPVYAEPDKPKQRKILFYRSPMNPSVTSPVPAKDAMGMDYVPVYADDDNGDDESAGTVKIDGTVVQQIAVRTAVAVRSTLSHTIRAVGRVDYNEELLVRLHPKIEGWIDRLHVDKTGQWVKKDKDLLSIYSPQLVTTQQEYLLALNNLKALEKSPIEDIRRGAKELVASSRERLQLLDVPLHQILELERTHKIKKNLHIHSPAAGIVINIGAREGQYITPATEIYMIADLTTVWVYADIYEYELPWVREGDTVDMQLIGVPGKTFRGHVAYIYPYAEAKTRTIKVRLVFKNPELLLKPEMFAEVSIYASKQVNAIVIPAEAVIRSGTRNQVFIVRGGGKFEPRLVKLGLSSNDKIAVLEGIKAGEEVVTSAQFLIDSESKLREATAKMLDAKGSMKQQSAKPPVTEQTKDKKKQPGIPGNHTEMMMKMNDQPEVSNHYKMHSMSQSEEMPEHPSMKKHESSNGGTE
jgi:membrane fusion protein, copper/silver efflux system